MIYRAAFHRANPDAHVSPLCPPDAMTHSYSICMRQPTAVNGLPKSRTRGPSKRSDTGVIHKGSLRRLLVRGCLVCVHKRQQGMVEQQVGSPRLGIDRDSTRKANQVGSKEHCEMSENVPLWCVAFLVGDSSVPMTRILYRLIVVGSFSFFWATHHTEA